MNCYVARFGTVLAILAASASSAVAQMTFNFINDGGATPQMMSGFAEAGALWSARISDPITLNVHVNSGALGAGVVAHTDTYYNSYSYATVRSALVTNRHSAADITSTNTLQAAPTLSMLINKTANNPNGVVSATPYFDNGLGGPGQAGPENNNTMRVTNANSRVLGLIPANSSNNDAIITVTNQSIFDYTRSNGINASQVDFVGVAAHEIGHALGFVSGVDILAGNSTAPGQNDNQLKYVTPLDLFRFSTRSIGTGGGVGVIDWTADSQDKYFSVDGGITSVASFSTGTVYEESHWKNGSGTGIMDPTAGNGQLLSISNTDLQAFDVIGYTLTPVPEPSSYLLAGAACLAGLRLVGRFGPRAEDRQPFVESTHSASVAFIMPNRFMAQRQARRPVATA